MKGHRLADRTEAEGMDSLGIYGGLAYLIYMRISERKIDAELREFFETEGKEK